jgi:hypothetical protein
MIAADKIYLAARACPALQQKAALFVGYVGRMVDRFQPLAVRKLAIVGAAFLIAGAGMLFHGRMPKQPTHDQIPPPHSIRCADVVENSPCSPRQQQRLYVEPPEFFPSR